ncbi:MAG: GAF domain-containing sensor histidine kinase [Chloroflexi bacterium]|nr:GAF domain-containing sensor histidine kinase [Chloroflexota bacterium]
MSFDLLFFFQSFTALITLALLVINFRKNNLHSEYGRGLFFFLLIYFLFSIGYLYTQFPLIEFRPPVILANWATYSIFLGSVLQYAIGMAIARRTGRNWYILGMLWFFVTVAAQFIPTRDGWWYALGYMGELKLLIYWMLIGGWVVFELALIVLIVKNYLQNKFPTVRNRLFIWGIAIVILLLGNAIYLFFSKEAGTLVMAAGILAIAYVVLTPRLPHLGATFRRMVNSVLLVLVEFIVFALVYLVLEIILRENLGIERAVVAAVLALALILIINPILRRIQKWVDRIFFGEEKDPRSALREFSQSISNILDLELLSAVVVDLVQEFLDVDRGILFLVEFEIGVNGQKQFHLTQSRKAPTTAFAGMLPGDCALANAWNKDRSALSYAEIQMLPRFQSLTHTTQVWLTRLNMDIYIPIHAQEEWVGLLALGPKASGASYFAEDIELLHTLADQTAVALQNTRLVESLMRVNKEFRRAYSAMEEAHTKLKRIDRTKSDFISIASHELRTPLTILSGYSQMLMEAPELQENKEYAAFLGGIYEGAQRLHEIVGSMLEVAKIDMHELALNTQPVTIAPIIEDAVQEFSKVLQERKLHLTLDESISVMPTVPGDSEALFKVFKHLLNNAIKYTPDEGSITLSSRHLPEGDARLPQGGVEIAVRDTGIGIDPRHKDLIFTKFYQTGDVDLHSSGKTKFKGGGLGLGLAIVRGIVQAHGGRVRVESSGYDEIKLPGSTFFISLPNEKKIT